MADAQFDILQMLQSGGITGRVSRVRLRRAELSSDEVEAVDKAIAQSELWRLEDRLHRVPGQVADAIHLEIEVALGRRSHRIYRDVPPDNVSNLKTLVGIVEALGNRSLEMTRTEKALPGWPKSGATDPVPGHPFEMAAAQAADIGPAGDIDPDIVDEKAMANIDNNALQAVLGKVPFVIGKDVIFTGKAREKMSYYLGCTGKEHIKLVLEVNFDKNSLLGLNLQSSRLELARQNPFIDKTSPGDSWSTGTGDAAIVDTSTRDTPADPTDPSAIAGGWHLKIGHNEPDLDYERHDDGGTATIKVQGPYVEIGQEDSPPPPPPPPPPPDAGTPNPRNPKQGQQKPVRTGGRGP